MPVNIPDELKNKQFFRIKNATSTTYIVADIGIKLKVNESINLLRKVESTGKQLLTWSEIESSRDLEFAIFYGKVQAFDDNGNIISNVDLAVSRTDHLDKSNISKISHQNILAVENIINIDFFLGSSATVDLTEETENFTFVFNGLKKGESSILIVKMGDTALTATYPENCLFKGGDSSSVLSTTGNTVDVLTLFFDGTSIYVGSSKSWS